MIFSVLSKSPLFTEISEGDLKSLLSCLSAKRESYQKGNFIFLEGTAPESVGIVVTGQVHILKHDVWGNENLLASIEPGDLFGEAMAFAGINAYPTSALAVKDTDVMFLNLKRITGSCTKACPFHRQLIQNMLTILARKNMHLVEKIEHITQRTTREKLLSYLSDCAKLSGSRVFNIRFDRQQLADYLSVDRSALSAELSKMQKEGLILYKKNHFELLMKDCI